METPVVNLSEVDIETVYEPSEDSFLLIDSLETDLDMLNTLKPQICMEIGSGSGVVITALAVALKNKWPAFFIAVDINPNACKVTKETSIINKTNIEVIQMDLVSAFNCRGIFDVIIFNPPYVVTDSIEIHDAKLITKTWAGGEKGREVMDRLFSYIPLLLSDNGIFYLVAIKENDPQDIIDIFKNMNMNGKIVAERKIRGEHLHVLRFVKNS
ncbi:hypothetical protein PV325_003393 [Microctonus aethiopoides]|uniref:Methyltransferase HEMK2 n=1 Tax=Microctonus aethiopoides TaxID=144406 RepID=A0AA39KXI4_9HYME|nr:hypothetical protein PV325_003393 [Microctonus aethiopoides]KAK0177327.1 hypothetical protein PV328_001395 [Microctonus aethiopoides]